MPHICLRCKTRLDAVEGLAPRCPACGGTKFSFVSARQNEDRGKEKIPDETRSSLTPDINQDIAPVPPAPESREEPSEPDTIDSIESIRILEPGRYDLNLLKLVESDDRVIKVGKDAHYRLDLNSMMRSKKKE